MKKIITLLAILTVAISAMAQTDSIKFVGKSAYTATVYGMTISGSGEKDTLIVSDNNSSITFPDMNVLFSGNTMTVPSMKITDITCTMTGNPLSGNAVYTWDKAAADTIVNVYVNTSGKYENKTLKISSLHATYSQQTKALEVTFLFKYGSMPGVVTFTETGYNTSDKKGDVNQDGSVNIADVNAVIAVICGGN